MEDHHMAAKDRVWPHDRVESEDRSSGNAKCGGPPAAQLPEGLSAALITPASCLGQKARLWDQGGV